MHRLPLTLLAALVPLAAGGATSAAAPIVEHRLTVAIDPAAGTLAVEDRIEIPPGWLAPTFRLNSGLVLESVDGARASSPDDGREAGAAYAYRLDRLASRRFTVRYRGRMRVARGGLGAAQIAERGVYLDGASLWYPRFGDERVRFSARIRVPSGWTVLTQGARGEPRDGSTWVWSERSPQTDIVLVAGRWQRYARTLLAPGRGHGALETAVYLREPDEALAGAYLDASARHLALYSRLLGPYPYAKFAVIENFRETGYGFPSFTLLGSRVMRLPFLLESSLPHEVLHDWWGNGVYVDHRGGNWSEGLTAYLADHLFAERRGRGARYRRSALQKYRSYVGRGSDSALRDFHGGHGGRGQAVGYGKAMMMFHMLRRRLGDETFLAGLRGFYRERRFTRAGFEDLRRAFEAAGGGELGEFFDQWVGRVGAPELTLGTSEVSRTAGGYRLRFTLAQTQPGAPYRLAVPFAVVLEGRERAWQGQIRLTGREARLDLGLPERPLRLVIDPEFDVFRRLDRGELPPSLGELLGARRALALLPSGAPRPRRAAYRRLAASLGAGEIRDDDDPRALPTDGAVWVLGWENRRRDLLAPGLAAAGGSLDAAGLAVDGQRRVSAEDCAAFAVRDRQGGRLGFAACASEEAIAVLARKLPHYGPYGYLALEGEGLGSRLRGEWPTGTSPLDRELAERGGAALLRLAPRAALDAGG